VGLGVGVGREMQAARIRLMINRKGRRVILQIFILFSPQFGLWAKMGQGQSNA
jgi:hypothetical protein